ncbi:hypothetical protein [Streptomyces sp. NRRL S-1813]|nr:hypothetical protein [Streptomyces sp. NRRL S-1813]
MTEQIGQIESPWPRAEDAEADEDDRRCHAVQQIADGLGAKRTTAYGWYG